VSEVGREHGLLLNCQFPHYGNIVTMYLPLTSEEAELTAVCDAIEDAARRVDKNCV
jgi:4-aminobutyrate aminotransferase-like enzyme